MTDKDKEAQRRSFAYGNVSLEHPEVTREMVNKVAERPYEVTLKDCDKLGLCDLCPVDCVEHPDCCDELARRGVIITIEGTG